MFGYSSIIVLFLALPALQAVPPSCDFQQIGSRFFYIEKNTTLDWFEAARTCRRMGGELATIRCQKDMDQIVPNLEWDSKYWLSLNDLNNEGTFTVLYSGQPASFLKWREGQPDDYNSKQHCVQAINYYMYDGSCEEKALFICEA
ncbi:hypothetical protein KR054_006094 [Drosophila jambulina]|nr:hypothetical protein KR054_006094 [Drosophila jambulina]